MKSIVYRYSSQSGEQLGHLAAHSADGFEERPQQDGPQDVSDYNQLVIGSLPYPSSNNFLSSERNEHDDIARGTEEEDEDAIMIKVIRPSPRGSTHNIAQVRLKKSI